jgi:hypothetical protein
LLAALGAVHSHFNALLDSGDLGRGYRRQAIILSLFAGLTTFRFVLQTLVVKEHLLANSPNKWLTAIDARDRSILEVRRRLSIGLLHHAVGHFVFPPPSSVTPKGRRVVTLAVRGGREKLNWRWFAGAFEVEHGSGGHSGCTYMTMTYLCQAFFGKVD